MGPNQMIAVGPLGVDVLTPLYQSQAKVLVKVPASTTVEAGGIPNLATEKEIASSEAVAALVADEPGADPAGLIADLSVS
ncbi:MAG TPA: hypothetical protein VEV82_02850, partial [Actinomycetota bacterium]|nr:hypothetical protein [Actinomycetota bacterium]